MVNPGSAGTYICVVYIIQLQRLLGIDFIKYFVTAATVICFTYLPH